MITVSRDLFQLYLLQSIRKFFKELTVLNHASLQFKNIYDCKYSYDQKTFESALSTYRGVIYIEQRDLITEEYRSGSKTFATEESMTQVQYATGTRYNTSLTLRIQTDKAQRKQDKDGKIELLKMESMVRKILQDNESITIYNFGVTPETSTSLKLEWRSQHLEYTRIPLTADDFQQGVFEVPVWCDVYDLTSYDKVNDYKIILDKQ